MKETVGQVGCPRYSGFEELDLQVVIVVVSRIGDLIVYATLIREVKDEVTLRSTPVALVVTNGSDVARNGLSSKLRGHRLVVMITKVLPDGSSILGRRVSLNDGLAHWSKENVLESFVYPFQLESIQIVISGYE